MAKPILLIRIPNEWTYDIFTELENHISLKVTDYTIMCIYSDIQNVTVEVLSELKNNLQEFEGIDNKQLKQQFWVGVYMRYINTTESTSASVLVSAAACAELAVLQFDKQFN